jgi:hypothetical protein
MLKIFPVIQKLENRMDFHLRLPILQEHKNHKYIFEGTSKNSFSMTRSPFPPGTT